MKGSLGTTRDAFVYKLCETAGAGEDINIEESMDIGNGV